MIKVDNKDLFILLLFFRLVFWLGDLNYRLNDLDIDTVKSMIKNSKLKDLMSYDQVQAIYRNTAFLYCVTKLFLQTTIKQLSRIMKIEI